MIRQIELADAADDPAERAARCTFVVVGAGYTGTEVAAQGAAVHRRRSPGGTPAWAEHAPRWLLLDMADRVLPGLDPPDVPGPPTGCCASAASRSALGTSVGEATADGVRLSDGQFVPTRTLVWCVGRPARPAGREPPGCP